MIVKNRFPQKLYELGHRRNFIHLVQTLWEGQGWALIVLQGSPKVGGSKSVVIFITKI